MKIEKLISLGTSVAYAILILGIVHDIAIFSPLVLGLTCLKPSDLKAMVSFSVVCGASFVMSGLILILLLKKIQQYPFLISMIFIVCVFLAVGGLLSVVYMLVNPFAWIGLLLNVSMLFITIGLKRKLSISILT